MNPLPYIVVQHEDCTTPGSTLAWLKQNQLSHQIIRPDNGDTFPAVDASLRVIVCGGIPNVDQESKFPWLTAEKKWLRELIQQNVPTVGLCLGAQLIADVMGARVFKSKDWEYGWQPLKFTPAFSEWKTSEKSSERFVFQCHGYQFDQPVGTRSLGHSAPTACQGFFKDKSLLAFQFHPEADQDWINRCVEVSKPTGAYCEPISDIPASTLKNLQANQLWFFSLLDHFFIK